jgi:surface protein
MTIPTKPVILWPEAAGTVSGLGTTEWAPSTLPVEDVFEVTFDTASQADKTVRIPFQGTMNVTIDWGDSTESTHTTANPEHTYAEHGTYNVKVRGAAARLGNDTPHVRWTHTLVACRSFGSLGLTSLQAAFRGFPGATLTVPQTLPANVTTLQSTFFGCTALTALDVSGWSTANVTSLYETFRGCAALTALDVSGWSTGKVTSLYATFYNCAALTALDVSGWSTANVTTLYLTFYGCANLTVDVSTFSVGKVTTAQQMFQSSGFTTAHYDALLIAWSAQTVLSGVPFHAGTAKYSAGGAAEAGRTTLAGAPNLWVITDGGPV